MPHISKPFSGCDLLPWYYEQPGIQNMCFFIQETPALTLHHILRQYEEDFTFFGYDLEMIQDIVAEKEQKEQLWY